jgi:hypothetical protein
LSLAVKSPLSDNATILASKTPNPEEIMPNSMTAPTQVAHHGPAFRKQKKSKISKTRKDAGANGTTRRTKSKAGSSRASKLSPRRKASAAEVLTSSTPHMAELEAQIAEVHSQFIASFRTSLGHARQVGQLLLEAKKKLGHGKFTDWLDRPRRPFARATANCYMRLARHGAILDEDSKHQSAGDMTLAAALRRLAKPRVKRTVDENSATNSATSSTSDGQAAADAGGRSAAATTQTTADATNGADEPDKTETAEARRDAAREDADRHRDEAGADGRAERADHRTRDKGNGTATREAEGATAADSSDTAGEDRPDDRAWLEGIPVRRELGVTAIFDADAILWRRLRPGFDALTRLIEGQGRDVHEFMAEFSHTLRFPHRVTELLKVSHPRHWVACLRCSGKGRKKGERKPCSGCDGAAYWTR